MGVPTKSEHLLSTAYSGKLIIISEAHEPLISESERHLSILVARDALRDCGQD